MGLRERLEKIGPLLEERAARYGVPGASLAVLHEGDTFEAATGVVNRNTGVATTPDSVFQIGSITKTFTATLVMQLVEEGRLDLDAPVFGLLPEAQFGDPDATLEITVRHLLTHTSGLDGDFFEDTGRGEDAVERYVLACRALPQIHPPGRLFSYCNAGFVVLGRIVEKLRAVSWDRALRAWLLERIGTEHMGTQPEEAILHRAAVGHLPDPETGEPVVSPIWRLNPSNGPAGATPFATARDLLRFARALLDPGAAPGGRILEERSIDTMLEKQVDLPAHQGAAAWGLGWMLFDWQGRRVVGHDGGTIGQTSALRILPDAGVALAFLANGGDPASLLRDLIEPVMEELAGVSPPRPPEPDPDLRLDLSPYVGTYERLAMRTEVTAMDGRLVARAIGRRGLFRAMPAEEIELTPVTPTTFVGRLRRSAVPVVVSFLEFGADGRPRFLHSGRRANRRTDPA